MVINIYLLCNRYLKFVVSRDINRVSPAVAHTPEVDPACIDAGLSLNY